MDLGKLYQIKKYFWLLYPTKEAAVAHAASVAAAAAVAAAASAGTAATLAVYWSEEFNCNVSYISPETVLFPVEVDGEYVKVISGEGVGWMIYPTNEEWTKDCIEEHA